MSDIKELKFEDVEKFYDKDLNLIKGIKKIYIQSVYPIIVKDNEELIDRFKIDTKKVIGIYVDNCCRTICVYYK